MKSATAKSSVSRLSLGMLALLALCACGVLGPQTLPAQEGKPQSEVKAEPETLSLPSIFLEQDPADADKTPLPPLQLRPLVLGETLTVNAKSRGIAWNEHTIHLVEIPQLEFELADEQLTAKTKASLLTFDAAPYRAHLAVYDDSGALLGTATAECETIRAWLGTYALTWRELSFDFGKSKAFANAKFFSVAISDHEIKTPEQWQKEQTGDAD